MPIHALLHKQQETEGLILSPEDIAAIVAAYEIALERLGVSDRKASMALLVAKSTLEIAREGGRDPRAAVRRGDPALPRQMAHLILPPELTVSEPDAEIVVALSKDRI